MYSRDFDDKERTLSIPDSYGGTMLTESIERQECIDGAPEEKDDSEIASAEEKKSRGFSLFDKLQLKGFQLTKESLLSKIKNIGLEEILIVAVAIYLIFSEDSDLECALILIALLFVS